MRHRMLTLLALLSSLSACGPLGDDGTDPGDDDGTDTTAPAAPTGLQAEVQAEAVVLTWDANAEADLAAYVVQRGPADGSLSELTRLQAGTTTFTDETAALGTTYVYAVAAEDGAGNLSQASVTVTVSLDPPVTTYWVDPGLGNDADKGTEALPFATLTHALSVAGEGQTVLLAPGTYGLGHEAFPLEVPAGVTVEPVAGGSAVVVGSSESGLGFRLGAGAALRNLLIRGFVTAVSAEAGAVSLEGLTLDANDTGLRLGGGAQGTVTDTTILNGTAGIELDGSARLAMTGGRISGMGPDCGGGTTGVYATGASSARLDDVVIRDVGGVALELRLTAQVELVGSTISTSGPPGCGSGASVVLLESSRLVVEDAFIEDGERTGIMVSEGTTLEASGLVIRGHEQGLYLGDGSFTTLDGVEIALNGTGIYAAGSGTLTLTASRIRNQTGDGLSTRGGLDLTARLTEFTDNGGHGLDLGGALPSEVDLGTDGDAGGNSFAGNGRAGLSVAWDEGSLSAVGNLWDPNVQGADAEGRYASHVITGPYGDRSQGNLHLAGGASLQL